MRRCNALPSDTLAPADRGGRGPFSQRSKITWPFRGAPKGPNKPAQGSALGMGVGGAGSPERALQASLGCALSGRGCGLVGFFPRALPWADLFQPFGLTSPALDSLGFLAPPRGSTYF